MDWSERSAGRHTAFKSTFHPLERALVGAVLGGISRQSMDNKPPAGLWGLFFAFGTFPACEKTCALLLDPI